MELLLELLLAELLAVALRFAFLRLLSWTREAARPSNQAAAMAPAA